MFGHGFPADVEKLPMEAVLELPKQVAPQDCFQFQEVREGQQHLLAQSQHQGVGEVDA